jgi:hypothetical protein
MAQFCAARINHHLNLPVTLVTDTDYNDSVFDRVINVEATPAQRRSVGGITESWKNFNRWSAYDLSPYDTTILLDTDYICSSPQLLKLLDFKQDFMCHRRRMYIGKQVMTNHIELFGNNIEMWWATVIKFNRSNEARCVFNMMRMIQENYDHYSKLYRFRTSPYRNDYALSIALNTVYGHAIPDEVEIPWKLMNVEFMTDIKQRDATGWQLEFDRYVDGAATKRFKITTYNQDLHMLNKDALFEVIKCHRDT